MTIKETKEVDMEEIHNQRNEDDEFKRIENENKWRETQLEKVRNLSQHS